MPINWFNLPIKTQCENEILPDFLQLVRLQQITFSNSTISILFNIISQPKAILPVTYDDN